MSPQDLQILRHPLDRISALSDDAWNMLAGLVSVKSVAAGEHLLRAGDIATRALFVRRGLLREYYVNDAGNESTRSFCVEGGFSGSLADLLSGRPAVVSIQALRDGEVWQLDWAQLDRLAEQFPSLMKLMRRIAEGLYVRKMTREFEMLTLPAAERYRRFAQEFAELDGQLPRHMVASYLGITPVHLSRICSDGTRQPAPATPEKRR